jgi:hypothetical protein
MQQTILSFSYTESWIYQAIQWANQFGHFFLLDYSANPKFYPQPYDMVLGVDLYEKVDFKSIATRKNDTQDFIFLGIPYEQNFYQIEHHAAHQHQVIFEPISYKPRFLLKFKDGKLIANRNYSETMGILDAIDKMPKDIPSSTKSTQRSFTDTSWETYPSRLILRVKLLSKFLEIYT